MIAPRKKLAHHPKTPPAWHEGFLAMFPAIRRHACFAFRHLDAEAKEEAVAGTIAHALAAYLRLYEQGKEDVAYPTILALYGEKREKNGRKFGTQLNVRDVSSEYCQISKGIRVARLDQYDDEEGWSEILVEDRHAGPAETAASRIDVADWFDQLPHRDRQIATALAIGNSSGEVARRFTLKPSRISQKRLEYLRSWRTYQGEEISTRGVQRPVDHRSV